MNKIIIIGCPGSGKSTFAKELKKLIDLPIYHLDLIWNKPDKTTLTREEFDKILKDIFQEEKWIMDGNYQRTLEIRIKEAETIFFLDYDLETCLNGDTTRVGIVRDDMPWKEEKLNDEFKDKIIKFSEKQKPEIDNLLNKYKNEKEIIIFKTREDAKDYLNNLK